MTSACSQLLFKWMVEPAFHVMSKLIIIATNQQFPESKNLKNRYTHFSSEKKGSFPFVKNERNEDTGWQAQRDVASFYCSKHLAVTRVEVDTTGNSNGV